MGKPQRRSSGGKEFNSDIEKLEPEYRQEKKKRQHKGEVILILVPVIMIYLIFWGLKSANSYKEEISTTEQFKMDQAELLHLLYHLKTQLEEPNYDFKEEYQREGHIATSDVGLLDLDSLSESKTVSEEILKLDDHVRQKNKPSATPAPTEGANIALDLKEMMLISPVTVLLDDEVSSSPEKGKMLEILFKSLKINPEPTLVNLSKHPHHAEIVEYLQRYAGHQYGADGATEVTSDDDENEVDATKDIPRLFVGGLPIGRFNDIINEYNNNELVAHLKESGKGLISVN